jgi:ZIP family zinc transporter
VQFDPEIWAGVIAATFAAALSTLGLISIMLMGDWGRRHSPSFSAFAVGFLAIAIFCHLFPEAFEQNALAGFWIAGGFFAVGFISLTFSVLARRRVDGRDIGLGYASLLALAAHSVVDGFAYETSFRESFSTGVLATLGLFLHEFPEAVIAFFLARELGVGRLLAGFYAFIAASLTTIIGALLIAFVLPSDALDKGALIGLTAGGLMFITIFHLGWHSRLAAKGRGYPWTMVGIVIALAGVVINSIIGHNGH